MPKSSGNPAAIRYNGLSYCITSSACAGLVRAAARSHSGGGLVVNAGSTLATVVASMVAGMLVASRFFGRESPNETHHVDRSRNEGPCGGEPQIEYCGTKTRT